MTLFKASCADDLWAQVALLVSLAHPDSTAGGGGGSREQMEYVLCQLQTYLTLDEEGKVYCDETDDRYIVFQANDYFIPRITNTGEPCPDMRVFFDVLFHNSKNTSTDETTTSPLPLESSSTVAVYMDEDGIPTVVPKIWSVFPQV
jgi:hypothetical protein